MIVVDCWAQGAVLAAIQDPAEASSLKGSEEIPRRESRTRGAEGEGNETKSSRKDMMKNGDCTDQGGVLAAIQDPAEAGSLQGSEALPKTHLKLPTTLRLRNVTTSVATDKVISVAYTDQGRVLAAVQAPAEAGSLK